MKPFEVKRKKWKLVKLKERKITSVGSESAKLFGHLHERSRVQ